MKHIVDDNEVLDFIAVLVNNISTRKLNDINLHITNISTGEDCGTLKEYIVERVKTLLGVEIRFD